VSDGRSAIIVAFGLPTQIEAIRHRHVPNASLGVPPHVTILSPFMPALDLDAGVRATLRDIAAGHRAFDVTYDRCAWFPDALYLMPDPASPFASLTAAVCRAFQGFPRMPIRASDPRTSSRTSRSRSASVPASIAW
jgi:2'-5' RNA ligase superfamily